MTLYLEDFHENKMRVHVHSWPRILLPQIDYGLSKSKINYVMIYDARNI